MFENFLRLHDKCTKPPSYLTFRFQTQKRGKAGDRGSAVASRASAAPINGFHVGNAATVDALSGTPFGPSVVRIRKRERERCSPRFANGQWYN